jgi:hypothetical protein
MRNGAIDDTSVAPASAIAAACSDSVTPPAKVTMYRSATEGAPAPVPALESEGVPDSTLEVSACRVRAGRVGARGAPDERDLIAERKLVCGKSTCRGDTYETDNNQQDGRSPRPRLKRSQIHLRSPFSLVYRSAR